MSFLHYFYSSWAVWSAAGFDAPLYIINFLLCFSVGVFFSFFFCIAWTAVLCSNRFSVSGGSKTIAARSSPSHLSSDDSLDA